MGRPFTRKRRSLSPKALAAQKARAQTEGIGGQKPFTEDEALTRAQAVALGRSKLQLCVNTWVSILEAKSSTNMDRIMAAREIADRCGMPRRTESEIVTEKPLTPLLIMMEGGLGWPAPVAADDAGAADQAH